MQKRTKKNPRVDLTGFGKYLQGQNISLGIIEKYQDIIRRFDAHSSKNPNNCTKKDLLDYLHVLQEQKSLQNRTRQQVLGVLKHYYNWLQQNGQILINPATFIQIRGTQKKLLYKLLSFEELNDFADLYYQQLPNKRNYLILSLCLFQGLQLSEWKALKVQDLDLQKGTVFIQRSLKANARKLTLVPAQIGVFYAFLQHRDNPEEKLFNSTPEVQKWMRSLRECYPAFSDFKQIRASLITHWIKTEGLRKAQYKAGHRYISSTERFLNNDLTSLQDNLNRFHPLN